MQESVWTKQGCALCCEYADMSLRTSYSAVRLVAVEEDGCVCKLDIATEEGWVAEKFSDNRPWPPRKRWGKLLNDVVA